ELVRTVREVRNRYMVDARTPLDVSVRCGAEVAADFQALAPFITMLAGVGQLACGPDVQKSPQAAGHVAPELEAYVSLRGLIDVAAEVKRLEKQIADKRKHLQSAKAKLDNPNFRDKAPAEVVQQQRDLVAGIESEIRILEVNLQDLQQS